MVKAAFQAVSEGTSIEESNHLLGVQLTPLFNMSDSGGGGGAVTRVTASGQIVATPASGVGDVALSHASSGVLAGSYGSSTQIPVFTVDSAGHITLCSTALASPVSVPWANLTGIPSVTAGNGLTGGGSLSGSVTLSVNFAGSGAATTVSRSDHLHNLEYVALDGSNSPMSGPLTSPNFIGASPQGGNGSGLITNGAVAWYQQSRAIDSRWWDMVFDVVSGELRVRALTDSGSTIVTPIKFFRSGAVTIGGAATANSFAVPGGTASGFLKANGTVDTSSYLPSSGGSTNKVAKWLSATTLGYGIATDDGVLFSIAGNVQAFKFAAISDGAGENYQVGNDLWLGDINVAHTAQLKGATDSTKAYLKFGTSGPTVGCAGSGNPFDVLGDLRLPGCLFRDDTFSSDGYAIYASGVTPNDTNASVFFAKSGTLASISGTVISSLCVNGTARISAIASGVSVPSLASGGLVRANPGGLLALASSADLPGGPYLPASGGSTNMVAKWTSSSALGYGIISDDGDIINAGTTATIGRFRSYYAGAKAQLIGNAFSTYWWGIGTDGTSSQKTRIGTTDSAGNFNSAAFEFSVIGEISTTSAIKMLGSGSDTYTAGALFCDGSGISIARPRYSNSGTAPILSFFVQQRGGGTRYFEVADGTTYHRQPVVSTSHLTLNGATRPSWGSGRNFTMLGGTTSIGQTYSGGDYLIFHNNSYFDGTNNRSISATGYSSEMYITPEGGLVFNSIFNNGANGILSYPSPRFNLDRNGNVVAPGSVQAGNSAHGTWNNDPTYAWFGYATQNNTTNGYSGILHRNDGTLVLYSPVGKSVYIGVNSSTIIEANSSGAVITGRVDASGGVYVPGTQCFGIGSSAKINAFSGNIALMSYGAGQWQFGLSNTVWSSPYSVTATFREGIDSNGASYFGSTVRVAGALTVLSGATVTVGSPSTFNALATFNNGILGAYDGSDAPSGCIGEYVSDYSAASVNLSTSGAIYVCRSISLTAGDWDVTGLVNVRANIAAVARVSAGINTSSGSIPVDGYEADCMMDVASGRGVTMHVSKRISVSGATTVYLNVKLVSTSFGAATSWGNISARRAR